MKSIIAAIAALAIAVVSGQQTGIVSVTSPIVGTVFTAGQDAVISWTASTATVTTIEQIQLASGDPSNLSLLDVIATDVNASAGSYIWSIPEDTAAATNYALIFGVTPDVAYSPRFTIAAANGSIPSSSAVASASSSSAAVSSAAPSISSALSSRVAPSSSRPSVSVVSASASSSVSASAQPSTGAASQVKSATVAALAVVGAAAMAII